MKWKHRKVKTVEGAVFSNKTLILATTINYNAMALREAIQKIEELSKEIDKLKGGGVDAGSI